MTQMEQALKQAGVAVPSQSQRLWTWIKDHPKTSVARAQSALGLTKSGASSLASQMEKRGMLTTVSDRETRSGRVVKYYTAVGTVYQVKPWPKKRKKGVAPTPHVAATQPAAAPVLQAPSKVDTIVDSLTVREARELYLKLKEMFK